jgi:hypothetical protein
MERLRKPPDPAEEVLREWLELGAFGVDWVRKWLEREASGDCQRIEEVSVDG